MLEGFFRETIFIMKDRRTEKNRYFEKAAAIAVALCMWQMLSALLQQQILLPSPLSVLRAFLIIVTKEGFLATVSFSLLRILSGFILAVVFGSVLAVLSNGSHVFEIVVWPYIAFFRMTPLVSFIILCFVWMSKTNLSVFVAFIAAFPAIYINLLAGFKQLDLQLSQMAMLFDLKWWQKLLFITLPQLKNEILAAIHIAIGLAFKAGITAEVIAIPKNSIGRNLYDAKLYLATDELFAWTFVILLVSLLCEKLILMAVNKLFSIVEGLLWI